MGNSCSFFNTEDSQNENDITILNYNCKYKKLINSINNYYKKIQLIKQ